MILWLNKAINEREQKALPTASFAAAPMGSISSIKSTPTQYYSTYQNKYTPKPYIPGNYAAAAGAASTLGQYSSHKFGGNTFSAMSTDKKPKSPIEDAPEIPTGTQLLQKNFSTTSISSGSVPYSTARLNGADHFKTYGGAGGILSNGLIGAGTTPGRVDEELTSGSRDKEGEKTVKPSDNSVTEVAPEPRPIPSILPIKYTQPA